MELATEDRRMAKWRPQFAMRNSALARGSLLALLIFASGCASNRFQLANDPKIDRNAEFAALERNRIAPVTAPGQVAPPIGLDEPTAVAAVHPTQPAPASNIPATTYPPQLASPPTTETDPDALLAANTNPANANLNNRTRVTETPRPGAPGTRLEPAVENTQILGRVVNLNGRPEVNASIRVLEVNQGNRVAAETASGPDGRFRIQNLAPGVRYEIQAATSTSGLRYIGSTMATPPEASAVVRLEPENRGGRLAGTSGWLPGRTLQPASDSENGASTGRTVFPRLVRISSPRLLTNPPAESPALEPDSPRVSPYPPGLKEAAAIQVPASPTNEPLEGQGLAFERAGLARLPLLGIDGRQQVLGNLTGELILLDFFGSWCGPCRAAVPHLNTVYRRYSDKGLAVVGIACEYGATNERLARASGLRSKLHIEYPLALSTKAAGESCAVRSAFGVSSYPTFILLNRQGDVLFRGIGGGGDNFARLDAAIRANLHSATE
jgi:thiol-disulfide isomerase/thioredoxin